eukprot:582501-Rhodomonas_salina.1
MHLRALSEAHSHAPRCEVRKFVQVNEGVAVVEKVEVFVVADVVVEVNFIVIGIGIGIVIGIVIVTETQCDCFPHRNRIRIRSVAVELSPSSP